MKKWQILTHSSGPWVINTGTQRLLVPEIPARWLQVFAGKQPSTEDVLVCLQKGNQADRTGWSEDRIQRLATRLTETRESSAAGFSRRSLWIRIPLLGPAVVRRLSGPLEGLTRGRWLAGLGLLGVLVPFLPEIQSGSGPYERETWWVATGLFLVGAVLHELGHAAALSAQGYPAGSIGAGLLFVIPVFYNDVSAISQLPRGGRLRVDLAGMAFQIAYGAGLAVIATGADSGSSAWGLATRMTYFAVGWSLLPFIRADGYWVLCDGLGIKNPDRPLSHPLGRWQLFLLSVFRLLNLAFLGGVAVFLPLIWSGRLLAIVPTAFQPAISWIMPLLLGLLWILMARRVFKLIGVLVGDLRRSTGGWAR